MADSTSHLNEEKYNVVELPSSVEIKESRVCKGEPGAFCRTSIKKDTRFGPYKGEIVKPGQKSNLDYRYAWEVFEKRSNVLKYTINASDLKHSNWMRNVNSARFYEEQNILSVQEGFSIYYVAMKDIKPGEELLTWFDPKLLKRTERRKQIKKERKRVGYTIELVPWSDEKKFVPEIIETKRARKKKVLSDMISFEEDAPYAQRSLKNVLKASKNKDAPFMSKTDKEAKINGVLANGFAKAPPNGVTSDAVDSCDGVIQSSTKPSDTTLNLTSPGQSESQTLSTVPSHQHTTKVEQMHRGTHHNSIKVLSPRARTSTQRSSRARQKIQRMGNDNSDTPKSKEEKSESFIKPFDPNMLRPIVFRKKENGCTEVEDHDEIYMTSKAFRNQCDDLCVCLSKSEMLSSKSISESSIPSCDENRSQEVKEDSCVHFALVPDHRNITVCNKIIFRCDICESAYNHAFSLKRHYLKIHINHRYLSKKDIVECQIDTFQTEVETKKSYSPDDSKNVSNECHSKTPRKEKVEVQSLKELACQILGYEMNSYQHKTLKEGKLTRETISLTTSEKSGQTSPRQEIEKIVSSSSDDLSLCETMNTKVVSEKEQSINIPLIEENWNAKGVSEKEQSIDTPPEKETLNTKIEFEKEQSKDISPLKETLKNVEIAAEKSTSNDPPDKSFDDGKDDSCLKPNYAEQVSDVLKEESEHTDRNHKSAPAKTLDTVLIAKVSTDDETNMSVEACNTYLKSKVKDIPETIAQHDMNRNREPRCELDNSHQEETMSDSTGKSGSHCVIRNKEVVDIKDTNVQADISVEKKVSSNFQSEESERPPNEKNMNLKDEAAACSDSNSKNETITHDYDEEDIDLIKENSDYFGTNLHGKHSANTIKQKSSLPDETDVAHSESLSLSQVCAGEATYTQSITPSSTSLPSSSSSSSSLLFSSPSLPTKPVALGESKKQTAQQQVILLVPIISPTAPKPAVSRQALTSSGGTLPKSPLQSAAGIATASPGSINLLTSQPSLPMMVLSSVSSNAALSLPPVFLQSQGFAPITQIPGSECTTPLPTGGSLQTFIVSNTPKSSTGSSQHNISTLSTNLTSVLSAQTSSFVQPAGQPTLFMSASNFSGQDEVHQPADLYRCHMCVLVFKTTTELKNHIKNDPHRFKGGIKQYACSHCSLRFRNKHNLNRHNLIHHLNREEDTDRKFRCLTCGKGFTTGNYLKMHERFHLGRSFPCKYGCQDVAFPNAASLVKHLRAVHPGLNLKEYIREKAMKERLMRHYSNNGEVSGDPPYSLFRPGMGFQAKRGRPKGSRNQKKIKNLLAEQYSSSNGHNAGKDMAMETPVVNPLQDMTSENNSIPKSHTVFKCKLCPMSFSFHLRLLQHRSKMHGLPQSVQEYLHEMSKDIPENYDSDQECSAIQFSPPPSPKTFFPNINARGAENIQKFIDGGLESLEMYKRTELENIINDGDIKPMVKLEWTRFNFPFNFDYRDDPTVFYDSTDGTSYSLSTELAKVTNECKNEEGNVCDNAMLQEKCEVFQIPSDILASVISDKQTERSKEKKEIENVTDDLSFTFGNKKFTGDINGTDCSKSMKNIVNDGPFLDKKTSQGKCAGIICSESNVTVQEREDDLTFTFSSGNQPSSTNQTEALMSQNDSAYSSLSSWLSGSSETEDLSSHSLLNKVLVELDKQPLILCEKSKENDENNKHINSITKFSCPQGIAKNPSSETPLLKALNLGFDKRAEKKSSSKDELPMKGVNIRFIEALDLSIKDDLGEIERLCRLDSVLDLKKEGNSSSCLPSSGRFQRSSDHHSDSILNMSDSSKHDHRRYSIWSRQHSHKTHSKNAELIGCPVVECVRKAQVMKEKASWKGCSDVGHELKPKQQANQKRKEAFASELGLMSKSDYQQSYHLKQQENFSIKPPDIWKIYDKIWFGKRGTITVVCSMCHRHFSCLELCLRHQLKKHPHIEPLSLEMEKGNYVEDLYYYYPMAYGILAHTQLIPDNMSPPEVYVCTRCSFPFKNISRLHSHIIACDPSQGEATGRVKSYKKKRLLPMMDRSQNSTSSKPDAKKPSVLNMQSNSFWNPGRCETVKKGYVISDSRKINLKMEMKAEQKPSAIRSSPFKSDLLSVFPGHRRRKNFGLLYNPSNHTRRRELYQVLDQHQCHGCNLKFKSMSLLERHVKKCSGKDKLRSQKPLLSGLTDDVALRKQHTCRYCNKRFTYIKGVDLHYKRICSVRKVKEEENTLTEEDLAHEAELQRIIEHMKWSKSLNKDSSDIILGHVRVEEDGTLIRVNKKRGRPFGKNRRRMKKKGFKWTTLKRHRSVERAAKAERSSRLSRASEKSQGEKEEDTKASVESPPLKKGKSRIEVKTLDEDMRKRKLSSSEPESHQPPPKRKGRPPGRPRKIEEKPMETTERGKSRRGRPKKSEQKQTNVDRNPPLDSGLKSEANSVIPQEVASSSCSRKESKNLEKQESSNQSIVKPPTRKRGRPKKFDPSDMESSYKKRKHQADCDKNSDKDAAIDLKVFHALNASSIEEKTKGEEKESVSLSKSKCEQSNLDGHKTNIPNRGKKKGRPSKADKEAKSISVFETTDFPDIAGKSVAVCDKKGIQPKAAKSRVIKIPRVSNKITIPEQKHSESEKNKMHNIDKTEKKNLENSFSKQEHNKIKSPHQQPASEELLKYLTSDTSVSLAESETKTNLTIGDAESNAVPVVRVEMSNGKEVAPKTKCVKLVSLASTLITPKAAQSEGEDSVKELDQLKEDQFVSSNHKEKQNSLQTDSSQGEATISNSNIASVTKSQPLSIALSSPLTSTRGQVMHTPLSVRVIAVPAGASKLVSSPSTIKLIKSPVSVASSSSKLTSPEIVSVVSNPFIKSPPPQLLSPGKSNSVSSTSPNAPSSKPVTVVHKPGLLRNISPSSFPLVAGTSIQMPRIITANTASSTLRLPRVISGGIRLPQAIGTHLGSAVIVQPATILQGKAKVAVVPTNIRTPPSRFACNTVPVKVGTVPTAAKIVKINNLGSPLEVKQGGTNLVTSPNVTHPLVNSATLVVGQQAQPVKSIVEGPGEVPLPTSKGGPSLEGNSTLLGESKKE